MNTVIYSKDLEPITVIDLPIEVLDELHKSGAARLAAIDASPTPKICLLIGVKVEWVTGDDIMLVVTPDEELAMQLQPDWLPGQRAGINSALRTIRGLKDKVIKLMRRHDD